MDISTAPRSPAPTRVLALVSGVVGLLAGLFLLGFFTLEPYGVYLAGFSLGHINDVLGTVQFATLAPVAWALGRRLPAAGPVRVATVVGVGAMVAFSVLSLLLVLDVMTFAQQIGPVIVAIVAIYGWLIAVNLVAHRTRALPRAVSRVGMLVGAGLLIGLVLTAAGYVLPGIAGRLTSWVGYGLGGAAWLGLPVYALLLASRVFAGPRPTPTSDVPESDHVPGGVSS